MKIKPRLHWNLPCTRENARAIEATMPNNKWRGKLGALPLPLAGVNDFRGIDVECSGVSALSWSWTGVV